MSDQWANRDASGAFETVHSGLTVRLIMTPRKEFKTCKSDDAARHVVADNTERYDYLPVLDAENAEERIVGLFHAAKFSMGAAPDGRVQDHLLRLTEKYLIGADASILDFVMDANTKPCRLVLAGKSIAGLVSLSDLQRLPVRAALFALITGLEIAMAEAIRLKHPNPRDWMHYLSSGRKAEVRSQMEKSKSDDAFVDALLFTQFCDKADILRKSFTFLQSKTKVSDWLADIRELRDNLAHANEYAASPEDARRLCGVVNNLLTLKKNIVRQISSG